MILYIKFVFEIISIIYLDITKKLNNYLKNNLVIETNLLLSKIKSKVFLKLFNRIRITPSWGIPTTTLFS